MDNRTLLSFRDIQGKYQLKSHFIEVGKVKKAIPGKWKNTLKNSQENPDVTKAETSLKDKCMSAKQPSRILYKILVERKATGPETKLKEWKEELQLVEESDDILKAMVISRKLTTYTKLHQLPIQPVQPKLDLLKEIGQNGSEHQRQMCCMWGTRKHQTSILGLPPKQESVDSSTPTNILWI
jgi:hypothetical protein